MTVPCSTSGRQNGHDIGEYDEPGRIEIIGHLAAGVAHELNNLLFVISGFSELARLDLSKHDPALANFDRIEEAVNRAKDLIELEEVAKIRW